MRKLFSLWLVTIVMFGMIIHDASAGRFGGGRSFGVSRSASSFARSSSVPLSAPMSQRSAGNKWMGPLAGLAAGGLLASLFMGHGGVGSGMFSWIIIGLIAWFAFNLLRRHLPAPVQYSGSNGNVLHDTVSRFTSNANGAAMNNAGVYPAGFDAATFLREAKVQFIRLQAAYDNKNVIDLREFTAPEVFAEIQLQFQERGDAVNQTDVVSLEAELLDAVLEPQGLLASVQFSGLIREAVNQAAAPFHEIWHFRKNDANLKWVVAGIQQS